MSLGNLATPHVYSPGRQYFTLKIIVLHLLFNKFSSSTRKGGDKINIQVGAAAVPALVQAPAGHVRHVDDDFAATALDHVPAGQSDGADPRRQY